MALGLPKSIHPDVREMDELRQKLEGQFNAYLNSGTPQSKLLNKPPPKEDIDRVQYFARVPPQRMNIVSQSVYERNRNWVYFVLARYIEQAKIFEETGYRHRLYTPEMLGKTPTAAEASRLTPAQEAQRRINRKLHGVKEDEAIPDGVVLGKHSPMGATAPQQSPGAPAPAAPAKAAAPTAAAGAEPVRMQRKVIIKRIIKKKADGTQEVVEQRTVVEVPVTGVAGAAAAPAPAPTPAPTAAPRPAAAPPAAPLAPASAQAPAAARPQAPVVRPSPPAAPPARPAAPAAPAARPAAPAAPAARPAKPVDKEIDDFFKKYNLK